MITALQVSLGIISILGILIFLTLIRCIGPVFRSLIINEPNDAGAASDGRVGVMQRAANYIVVEEAGVTAGICQEKLEACPKIIYSERILGIRSPVTGEHRQEITCSCAICLHDYEDSVDVLRLLPECGHMFHVVCIDQWLALHATCPICRYSLQDNDDTP